MTKAIYPVIGPREKLPFYLTGIGVCDPEYNVERKTGLASHQFLFTSSGEGRLYADGEEYVLKAGSAFYLAPGKPHRYCPAGENWVTNWLVFRGEFAGELMKNMGFDGFAFSECIDTESCGRLFKRIYAAAGDPVNGGENSSALIYEYILLMRRAMLLHTDSTALNRIAAEAVMYIDKNFAEDISDEKLAALSGVSVQHFCRVFRAEMSMRPLEYLALRRLSEAKSMLLNTDMKIGDIGSAVGYGDRNYFSIVFRKYEGVSPVQYRRSRG